MNKFDFRGDATLRHLNARKEGPEDETVFAVDLKFEAIVGASAIAAFEPALVEPLFHESGAVRNIQMGPVTFASSLRHYRLEALGSCFSEVELKKFTFQPKDGFQFVMTFGASFKPSGDEVARFAEYLAEPIDIDLSPADGELDLQAAA